MKHTCIRRKNLALVLMLIGTTMSPYAFADDREVAIIYGDEIQPSRVTFGRSARLLSEVSENVTVITAEDIRRYQAKTVADVLQFYPGVLPTPHRMRVDFTLPNVQGLPNRQCLVTLDGIPLNNLNDGAVDIGFIPTGFLQRIEITKGPASSVWGRSVGAIINLVTEDPNPVKPISGRLDGYYGSNVTKGYDAVVSGTIQQSNTGYFLAATNNGSDGFFPHVHAKQNALYGKVTQGIGSNTNVSLLWGRSFADRGLLQAQNQNVNIDNTGDADYGVLHLEAQLSSDSAVEASLYRYNLSVDNTVTNISPIPNVLPVSGIVVQSEGIRQESHGLQLSYKLSKKSYWLSTGFDGVLSSLRNTHMSLMPPPVNTRIVRDMTQIGTYASGGWNIFDPLTLTAAVRYDHYNLVQDAISPELGLIYKVDELSLLRLSGAYGYSLPTLTTLNTSGGDSFERLWRIQLGLETNRIPGIWWKTNLFYDETRNIRLNLKFLDMGPVTIKNMNRQGIETEIKTIPIFNTTFSAGYTFTDIYDSDRGDVVQGLPRHHVVFNTNFRSDIITDVLLSGRYVFWNSPTGKDAMIWDLYWTQKIFNWRDVTASAQFAVHNIFQGSQYPSTTFPNQPRWYEGGIRMEF